MEGFVFVVILLLSAVGWIMNALKEYNQKQQNQQQRPAQQNRPKRSLQAEIENFIKEIQQEQKPQPPRPAPEPARPPQPVPKAAERTSYPPSQKGARKKQQQQRKQNSKQESQASKKTSPTPATTFSFEQPSASTAQMESYLQSQAQQSFSQELEKILSPDQLQAIQRLAAQQGSQPSKQKVATHSAVEMLKSQQNIQNAFVINEILQPPLSMRNK